MYVNYIKQHITLIAILLFIIIFGTIQIIKPSCFYNKDGSTRDFGVGYKNKTILPLWLVSILLGILSYLAVMYYVSFSRFL
jgi:hypothetical protein